MRARALAILGALCCLAASSCETPRAQAPSTSAPPTKEATAPTQAPTPVAPLPAGYMRGVCFAHNWQWAGSKGYGTAASAEALDHMKGLGVGWISVTPFGWMSNLQDPKIGGEHAKGIMPPGAENQDRMKGVFEQARARGLKVMLKPHIWIGKGEWRGSIAPKKDGKDAWDDWWRSYESFILYYARMARDHKADSLVLGVELVSALKTHPDRFLALVAKVRAIYSGSLTYSANWDEYLGSKIWSKLDYVGVQLYPNLSDKKNPTLEELTGALGVHLKRWNQIAAAADKPLLLTEVGYKSAPTAVSEPFGWPERLPKEQQRSDEAMQELAYRALLTELPRHDRVQGLFLWKYFTDKDTGEEGVYGFSPRGKKAERVIRQAFASPATKASTSSSKATTADER